MKSRLLLMAAIIAVLGFSASAQKEMLTKEEAVNYLNKRLQEVDGRYATLASNQFVYSYASLEMKEDKIHLSYTRLSSGFCRGGYSIKLSYIFSPAEVKSIVLMTGTSGDPVRTLRIKFSARTARAREDHSSGPFCNGGLGVMPSIDRKWGDVAEVDLPFFATAPENRARIEKALLHLTELAKAEDDPFDN